MTENDVLQLVRRWQDPGTWQTVLALNTEATGFESRSDKLGSDARFILDRADIEQARELKAESDHLRNCAADVRRQRAELASQFMQIENWVREHRPELLEFVPIPKFDGDPSNAIRDLKRLESRIRKPQTATAKHAEAIRTEPATVEQLEQRKIILPTNPDIAEVANLVTCGMNPSEASRQVAGNTGNAESLRAAYNRWRRENSG